MELYFDEPSKAIAVMREVAQWGHDCGLRVWPLDWLTMEELVSADARPEDFCIGKVGGEVVCGFILQRQDQEYWRDAPKGEAVYLHKLCVRRAYAHQSMSKQLIAALKDWCKQEKIPYLRLDTAMDEEKVKAIYLDAGFQIVKTIECGNGRTMALYQLPVSF
ncbi:MAG: GNAT family N-acetyltransferase [Eubacteriales bacterium]|nr:GNAT family N-acetyltransferase [Eubacteriales bacterium]